MPVKKYVLFSPIGNHDPFGKTKDAVTEGPLLHIVRHYKPEIVYLFMTKEMYEKNEKDCRYEKCIRKVAPDCIIKNWEKGHDIINAHNFDEFIEPYNGVFEKIKADYPDYEIIFNVSSGTPQMIADIILEWRPVIVDSLVMSLVQTRMITEEHFLPRNEKTGGIFLTKEGLKIFIRKLEEKLKQHNSYLTYVEYPLSFRESLQFQVGSLVKAIENHDTSIYRAILIR